MYNLGTIFAVDRVLFTETSDVVRVMEKFQDQDEEVLKKEEEEEAAVPVEDFGPVALPPEESAEPVPPALLFDLDKIVLKSSQDENGKTEEEEEEDKENDTPPEAADVPPPQAEVVLKKVKEKEEGEVTSRDEVKPLEKSEDSAKTPEKLQSKKGIFSYFALYVRSTLRIQVPNSVSLKTKMARMLNLRHRPRSSSAFE